MDLLNRLAHGLMVEAREDPRCRVGYLLHPVFLRALLYQGIDATPQVAILTL
jgi:hypothetical protein